MVDLQDLYEGLEQGSIEGGSGEVRMMLVGRGVSLVCCLVRG